MTTKSSSSSYEYTQAEEKLINNRAEIIAAKRFAELDEPTAEYLIDGWQENGLLDLLRSIAAAHAEKSLPDSVNEKFSRLQKQICGFTKLWEDVTELAESELINEGTLPNPHLGLAIGF